MTRNHNEQSGISKVNLHYDPQSNSISPTSSPCLLIYSRLLLFARRWGFGLRRRCPWLCLRRYGRFLGRMILVWGVCRDVDESWEADDQPVRIFWKASSTLLASRAEVSMNDRLLSPALPSAHSNVPRSLLTVGYNLLANCFASSVGTALRCLKSLLFPTSIITIFASAWSRSSFNHLCTFSYVWCLLIS